VANTKIHLLLGGNEGDRQGWLAKGRAGIEAHIGSIIRASGIYETGAWGKEDQPPFLNQVVALQTSLTAREVLQQITVIEQDIAYRIRAEKWAARTLDIDILFFGNEVIQEEGLTIPHAHLQERRFALMPLCEVAPDLVHPLLGKSCRELLAICPDHLPVTLLQASHAL